MPRQLPAAMTIGVTGASGLVGSALAAKLTEDGHRVIGLHRQPRSGGFAPAECDAATPLSAVVHLAGEPIASGRWNAARKSRIRAAVSMAREASAKRYGNIPNRHGYWSARRPSDSMATVATNFWMNPVLPAKAFCLRWFALGSKRRKRPRNTAFAWCACTRYDPQPPRRSTGHDAQNVSLGIGRADRQRAPILELDQPG